MVCGGRLQGLGENQNAEVRIQNAELRKESALGWKLGLPSLCILCDLCGKKLLAAEIAKPTRKSQRKKLRCLLLHSDF
jgi:hypothetical protein